MSIWDTPGPPDAPAVVLLHGWMATAALNWYGTFGPLSRHWRVVAPNLRGHGACGMQSPPFSVEACADDIAVLIERLGLDHPVAVGYSMGGAVAQTLAARYGEMLGGLVLCATAARFNEPGWKDWAVRQLGRGAALASRAWPSAATGFLHWQLRRYDRAGNQGTRPGDLVRTVEAQSEACERAGSPDWALAERGDSHLAGFIEAGLQLNNWDSRPWLADVKLQSAVVMTKADEVVAPWRQQEMAALLAAKTFEVEAGHDAVVAKPRDFVAALARACAWVTEDYLRPIPPGVYSPYYTRTPQQKTTPEEA